MKFWSKPLSHACGHLIIILYCQTIVFVVSDCGSQLWRSCDWRLGPQSLEHIHQWLLCWWCTGSLLLQVSAGGGIEQWDPIPWTISIRVGLYLTLWLKGLGLSNKPESLSDHWHLFPPSLWCHSGLLASEDQLLCIFRLPSLRWCL